MSNDAPNVEPNQAIPLVQTVPQEAVRQAAPVRFDWLIYGDATLAGLSVLIPFPFVDSLFERFFRRRIIGAIAARRRFPLSPQIATIINNRRSVWSMVWGCLLFPFVIIFELIIKLSRKLLYFLTIKRSIDALNYYWQRAFLLDYLLQRGYLNSPERAEVAISALEKLLEDVGSSPLTRLARQIVTSPWRILRSLWRVRQGQGDRSIEQTRATMSQSWASFSVYLQTLAQRYEDELSAIMRARSL